MKHTNFPHLFPLLLCSLVACGGGATTKESTKATAVSNAKNSESPQSEGSVKFLEPSWPCMQHQVTGSYNYCLSGADGRCYHYGSICQPDDLCMRNQEGRFQTCEDWREDGCAQWGKDCVPQGECIAADDGRYRVCKDKGNGVCKGFGELCLPSGKKN